MPTDDTPEPITTSDSIQRTKKKSKVKAPPIISPVVETAPAPKAPVSNEEPTVVADPVNTTPPNAAPTTPLDMLSSSFADAVSRGVVLTAFLAYVVKEGPEGQTRTISSKAAINEEEEKREIRVGSLIL